MSIASKSQKTARKRKRAWPVKISSSTSVAAVPPKMMRNQVKIGSVASPEKPCGENGSKEDSFSHCPVSRASRSLENVQQSQSTARRLVDLQLDNDSLRRDVRELKKNLKDLTRQLKQEREFYEDQKYCYLQEIRSTIKDSSSKTTQTKEYIESDDDDDSILVSELRRVRQMFYKQRNIACRLSEKFLRIRHERDRTVGRMRRLEIVYSTVIDELLKHIAEVRVYFASFRKGVLLEKSAVANLVDKNAKLGYNNAILQLELLKCEKKLAALKKRRVNLKDAMEVEKFLAECRSNQLLAVAKGRSSDSSAKLVPRVVRTGSLINIPVAVVNGNRVETKLAPLFSIVPQDKKEKDKKKEKPTGSPRPVRRARSVPSKVWRVMHNFEKRRSKKCQKQSVQVSAKSEMNLVRITSSETQVRSVLKFDDVGSEKSSATVSSKGRFDGVNCSLLYEEEGHFTPE